MSIQTTKEWLARREIEMQDQMVAMYPNNEDLREQHYLECASSRYMDFFEKKDELLKGIIYGN